MTVPASVVEAVRTHLRDAGLKSDMSVSRISRAVREAAEAAGVDAADVMRAGQSRRVRDIVLERLAVHESWFFREPRQFAALAQHILPTVAARASSVHLWCVGCGLGQEAWTAAMVLAESWEGEWRVTATDLSAAALEWAEQGVYRGPQLRGLSAERRTRFLRRAGDDEWAVAPSLRPRVTFVRQNVVTDPAPVDEGSCQVVLCRNVLIYLRDEGVAAALAAIERALDPEGWLLIGTAESLWRSTERFTVVTLPDAYAYRKAGAPVAGGVESAGGVGVAGAGAGVGVGAAPAPRAHAGVGSVAMADHVPDVSELLARAAAAAGEGRHDEAAQVFRQAAYLDRAKVEAHEGLAAALEAVGDARGAARARAVVERLRRRHA